MAIDAVDRVVAILEHLAKEPGGATLSRIASKVGLAPSTLHRYLKSLQDHGIVRQAGDRTYGLTPRLYLLGVAAANGFDLEHHAQASLERLAQASGETLCMMVREDDQAVCVARINSNHHLKIEARIGSRADLRLGATGRVLLAFAAETLRDELLARPPIAPRTSLTITDPERIRDALETIRRDGYYVSRSQVDEGVTAVAAPVHDHTGEVIAALAIVAPDSRATAPNVLDRMVDLITREAQELSATLGYPRSLPLIERSAG